MGCAASTSNSSMRANMPVPSLEAQAAAESGQLVMAESLSTHDAGTGRACQAQSQLATVVPDRAASVSRTGLAAEPAGDAYAAGLLSGALEPKPKAQCASEGEGGFIASSDSIASAPPPAGSPAAVDADSAATAPPRAASPRPGEHVSPLPLPPAVQEQQQDLLELPEPQGQEQLHGLAQQFPSVPAVALHQQQAAAPSGSFSRLQLRQSWQVAGLSVPGWEQVQPLAGPAGAQPPGDGKQVAAADAAQQQQQQDELLELFEVWQRDWHCFPPWKHVIKARKYMLLPEPPCNSDSTAKQLGSKTPPPPDPAPASPPSANMVEWCDLSYPEKRMVVELAVREYFHTNFKRIAADLVKRCRVRRAAQETAGLPARGDTAVAAAAPQDVSPLAFSDHSLWSFMRGHRLRQVGQEGVAPACRLSGSTQSSISAHKMDSHKPGFDGMAEVSGRNYNLTVQEVEDWIIRPSLEASGGLSYMEMYGGHGVARPWPEGDTKVPNKTVYVPCARDMDFCELAFLCKSASTLGPKNAALWLDPFCRRRFPAPPATGIAAPPLLPPPPPLPPQALLRCSRHVALLAHTSWPWAPELPPPSLTHAGCVSAVRAALAAGLQPCLLARAYADTTLDSHWHSETVPPGEVLKKAVAALQGMEAPPAEVAAAAAPAAADVVDTGGTSSAGDVAGGASGDAEEAAQQEPTGANGAAGADAHALWSIYRSAAGAVPQLVANAGRKPLSESYERVLTPPGMSAPPEWRPALADAAAVVRITRVAQLEGVTAPAAAAATTATETPAPTGPAATAAKAASPAAAPPAGAGEAKQEGEAATPLRVFVLDEQLLRCPAGVSQAEADELVRVWVTQWACMPDLAAVLRARAACDRQGGPEAWAGMSWGQRRAACELVLLYGERAALWQPSAAAQAEARAASSRPDFVTVVFLKRFAQMHGLRFDVYHRGSGVGTPHADKRGQERYGLDKYETLPGVPGQPAWNPRAGGTPQASTSWVCANVVVPATKAYGTCYSDLFLSREAQEAFLPPPPPPPPRHRFSVAPAPPPPPEHRYCLPVSASKERAFASHAWATDFSSLVDALWQKRLGAHLEVKEEYPHQYWIDIFHKNQHADIAVHDLSDNLMAAGQVALVVHPYPHPLALTRVWCLFEIMTALQLDVPIKMFPSQAAYEGFQGAMSGGNDLVSVKTEVTPAMEAEVDLLDVSTAQATVASDKEMILGMIRDSIGIDSMNAQVRALFKRLLPDVANFFQQQTLAVLDTFPSCFGGDGIVGVVSSGPAPAPAVVADRAPQHCLAACGSSQTPSSATPQARPTRVADLQPGDWVVTATGGVSRVVLVTADPVGPEGMEMCALPAASQRTCAGRSSINSSSSSSSSSCCAGNTDSSGCSGLDSCSSTDQQALLLVTADHPVLLGGVWRLPRDVAPVRVLGPQQVPYGHVYNLELDPPAPLDVSSVVLVSLGQDTSGEARCGVDPASDALFGWGWRDNPQRARQVRQQEARVQQRTQREEGRAEGRERLERVELLQGRQRRLRVDDKRRLGEGGVGAVAARALQRGL